MPDVPGCNRYDPEKLREFRYLLKDPESDVMKVEVPHHREKIVVKANMAHCLADYCLAAGIRLGVKDFLFRRRKRRVVGQGYYTKTPLMKQWKMLQMYKTLYFGGRSKTFTDLLHSLGWWSITEQGPTPQPAPFDRPHNSKAQQELDLSR